MANFLASLEIDVTGRAFNAPSELQAPKTKVGRSAVTLIDASKLSKVARETLLVGLYKCGDLDTPAQVERWVLTLIDLNFPTLLADVGILNLFDVTRVPIGTAMSVELDLGDFRASLMPDMNGGKKFLPNLVDVKDAVILADPIEVVGVLSILLFALGKQPTQANMAAFNTNRPRAVLAKAGVSARSETLLSAEHFPGIDKIRAFKGYFDMKPRVRTLLVEELIRWTRAQFDDARYEVVATQVKLWRGSGLTAIKLIRMLLMIYHEEIARIKPLLHEAEAFSKEYATIVAKRDDKFLYRKVIEGDRFEVLRSNDFPELLSIAREYASRCDERFSQYASAMSRSAHLDNLIAQCVLTGNLFPAQRSSAAMSMGMI